MQVKNQAFIWANILGLIAVLVVNYLSNALPINGKTPGQLSDQYVNLFVPSGSTFAIWGIIYLGLLVFAAFQIISFFTPSVSERLSPLIQQTAWLFALTCVFNIAWLFAWHYEQVLLSVGCMIALLVTLILLNLKTNVGIAGSRTEKWVAHLPFNIYQGWITVALIANITALLVANDWTRFGLTEQFWTIALIVIGTGVAGFMVLSRNHVFHGLAVIWAFYGIYAKRKMIGGAESEVIALVALICIGVLAIIVAFRFKAWLSY